MSNNVLLVKKQEEARSSRNENAMVFLGLTMKDEIMNEQIRGLELSTRAGDTEYFQVGVGLHQGSALSPLLFILIMDVLQTEIGKEPPWVMLFADDLVICEHSGEEVELQLERWRETFESHGLRVSRGKTEYMPCPEKDQTIYIQEQEVKTVKTFKYLGSMFDANGGAEKDCLVKMEGNYWCDVRQEHTNKVERQSVQDGYKTGHGVWSRVLGS